MELKIIGERIKNLRIERLKLSQEAFAELVGLSRSYLCRLELWYKNLTIDTLNKICDGLQISFKEFFDFDLSNFDNLNDLNKKQKW